MGDDDTFFNPGGISAILAKYDHTDLLYIGSQSETHWQNNVNSHTMAYGGGGFAISWPLAEALNRTLDACLERHVELWGSDMRVAYCCAELGVRENREWSRVNCIDGTESRCQSRHDHGPPRLSEASFVPLCAQQKL